MSELWLPNVIKKPLSINRAKDPYILVAGAVFHIAVSEGDSLLKMYQDRNDGIESTGYIRRSGQTEQYRPVNVECDAQLAGNSWFSGGKRWGLTSWESQGMGPGEWTGEQIAEIKRIIMRLHTEHGVPLQVNPDPQSLGFGYHRMFDAWNPNGHSCPGDDRVKQFHGEIMPWMRAGGTKLTPKPKPKPKGGRLAVEKAHLAELYKSVASVNKPFVKEAQDALDKIKPIKKK